MIVAMGGRRVLQDQYVVHMSGIELKRVGRSGYRQILPRLTDRVMRDLAIYMACFGLLVGFAFPLVVMAFGVPSETALQPGFLGMCLVAGLLVAAVNWALARAVIGVRLRALARGMHQVERALVDAAYSGDWSQCDPQGCMVEVDSADELGEVATSFNRLVTGLATSHRVSDGITAVSEQLSSHLELAALTDATLAELVRQANCDAAALVLAHKGTVTVAGSIGIADADRLAENPAVLQVLQSGEARELRLPEDVVVDAGLLSVVPRDVRLLPIQFGVVTLGVLVVGFTAVPSSEADAVLRAALSGMAVAINNALNHEDLQRVAALDQLTSLYNRRFGMQRLQEEFGRAQRTGDPIGLLMFDLDHFKSINDSYGHLTGDRVLRAVADAARGALRQGDVLMRYGGEEFLVVLPGAGRSDVQQMAERIRRVVDDVEENAQGNSVTVTVSVGGCSFPGTPAQDPTALISVADQALYAAKAGGRDRAVLA